MPASGWFWMPSKNSSGNRADDFGESVTCSEKGAVTAEGRGAHKKGLTGYACIRQPLARWLAPALRDGRDEAERGQRAAQPQPNHLRQQHIAVPQLDMGSQPHGREQPRVAGDMQQLIAGQCA